MSKGLLFTHPADKLKTLDRKAHTDMFQNKDLQNSLENTSLYLIVDSAGSN